MGNTLSAAWLQEQIGHVASDITPAYLRSKRWFGSKSRSILGARAVDFDLLPAEPDLFGLLLLEISYAEAAPELYLLPLAFSPEEQVPAEVKRQPEGAAAMVRTPQGVVWAYDAFAEDPFCALLYGSMYDDTEIRTGEGKLIFRHIPGRMDSRYVQTMRRISSEQSNTSLVFNDALILKVFRKLSIGRNPDFEVPYFLTTHTDFAFVPKVAGFIEYQTARGEPISVGVLQDFVVNQGDGYTLALNRVRDYFSRVLPSIE
ncbi:MAG: hypothetical protein JOZ41_11500, partial [Chloroflexi bacterium]|nr:hypothetical protein [Chloroflexota bacterium]